MALVNLTNNFLRDSQYVNSNAATTTTSTTFSVVGGMSITAVVGGRYELVFSATVYTDSNNATGELSVFINGVQNTNSTRDIQAIGAGLASVSDVRVPGELTNRFDVNPGDTLDIRFRSVNGGTIGIGNRNYILRRVPV